MNDLSSNTLNDNLNIIDTGALKLNTRSTLLFKYINSLGKRVYEPEDLAYIAKELNRIMSFYENTYFTKISKNMFINNDCLDKPIVNMTTLAWYLKLYDCFTELIDMCIDIDDGVPSKLDVINKLLDFIYLDEIFKEQCDVSGITR